ncbi:MAG: hypothetical protein WAN46_13765 [Gammaproteobacteria bacterium]
MTVEIERTFREKCNGDDRLRLLLAQWDYDRQLVAQALQAVPVYFAHYSRHDVSHSNTILVQITRVLGEDRIAKLSATDLWLLLEAAYWHDIGMVIDDRTAREWLGTDDFGKHLDALISGQDPEIAAAADLLRRRSLSDLNQALWPIQVRKALTYVLAELARRSHAERSGQLVRRPEMLNLASPRVLIPERLFRWLSEVTESHGRSIHAVMVLPDAECGLATDTCHPRFVAFMLRLGDLLDLDNGRFCPVLTATLGALPSSSMSHAAKHAAITRFYVSPERVEVTAECDPRRPTRRESANTELPESTESIGWQDSHGEDPYGAYEAVSSWFDWLTKELEFLATRWADIAPPEFGGAPSIGEIKSLLKGYISLDVGQRPRFEVDEPAFLGLVRSNNLYQDRHAWLQELLSNASDATLLRLLYEESDALAKAKAEAKHPARDFALSVISEPFKDIQKELSDYPIRVDLKQEQLTRPKQPKPSEGQGDASKRLIRVMIADRGTGISRDDLRFMLTIGSSSKNPARRAAIQQLPEHFRPTGSFGIGLQSVFMVTDEVIIKSTHVRTGDRLHIRIRRSPPPKPRDVLLEPQVDRAGVYIRELDPNEEPLRPGTEVSFVLPDRPLVEGLTPDEWPTHVANSPSPNIVSGHLLTVSGSSEIDELRQRVESLASSHLVPIRLDGNEVRETTKLTDDEIKLFDPETSCYVRFRRPSDTDNLIDVHYRGTRVSEHSLLKVGLIRFVFGIERGEAKEFLTADRQRFTEEGNARARALWPKVIRNVFPAYLAQLAARRDAKKSDERRKETEALERASLYAYLFLSDGKALVDNYEEWRAVRVVSEETPPSAKEKRTELNMGQLVAAEKEEILYEVLEGAMGVEEVETAYKPKGIWYSSTFRLPTTYEGEPQTYFWFNRALRRLFARSTYLGRTGAGSRRYHLWKSKDREPSPEEQDHEEAALKQELHLLARSPSSEARPTRIVLPSPSTLPQLGINAEEVGLGVRRDFHPVHRLLISPLEFTSIDGILAVSSRQLSTYFDWMIQRAGANRSEDQQSARELLLAQIEKFCGLVIEAVGENLYDVHTDKPFDPKAAIDIVRRSAKGG